MARLYANEHFPAQAVAELRRLGHDVLTVRETGQAGVKWPDHKVLRFATGQNRAVVTFNRGDFRQLHRESPNHACTQNLDFGQLARRIHEAIAASRRWRDGWCWCIGRKVERNALPLGDFSARGTACICLAW